MLCNPTSDEQMFSDDSTALSPSSAPHSKSSSLSAATSNILSGLRINFGHWIINSSDLEVSQHLNSGGFGDVYRGIWKKTGEEVAIKTLKNEEALSLVAKEVYVLINVSHEHVLRFRGICPDPPLIVTELCHKGSVFHLLTTARINPALLPWDQRVRIALEAAKGMTYLHAKDIYHRDLKSLNLLLGLDDKVKVADFGFARFVEGSHLSAKSMPHNPRWLAPEIFVNQPFTKAADVYSFGMVLWELITCDVPFTKEYPGSVGNMQLICAIAKESIRPEIPGTVTIPGCTSQLMGDYIRLMKRCWAQDYRSRPDFSEVTEKLTILMQRSAEVAVALQVPDRSHAYNREKSIGELHWDSLEHLRIDWEQLEVVSSNKKWETGRREKVYSGLWYLCEGEVSITLLGNKKEAVTDESMLHHEVLVLERLHHPNVQRLFGFARGEALALVSELCVKGTLRYLFDALWWLEGCEGKLNSELHWQRKLRMAIQIAKAMSYIHRRQVIHGSLSSKNVMVDKDMRVCIWDFSNSLWLDGDVWHSSPKLDPSIPQHLNPRWVAPEVLLGQPHSKASDVYSFAILMWEVLTLQMPFAGKNHLQVVHLVTHCGERPAMEPEGVLAIDFYKKAEYMTLMARCWAQEPAERPTFDQIAEQLSRMQEV